VVRVKVLEVDQARKRIALTLRLEDEPGAVRPGGSGPDAAARPQPAPKPATAMGQPKGALADAFQRARDRRP
jgi:uncharacterized protein